MVLTIIAIVVVCFTLLLAGFRRRSHRAAALGSMSEQWLAENRSSRRN
jgi:hypothetical protein